MEKIKQKIFARELCKLETFDFDETLHACRGDK